MSYPSFSAGDVLTATDMNAVGLWLVKTSTVTAQSSLNITNCFSSDYDNYRIVFNLHTSADANVYFRMRTTGDDATANYARYGFYWSTVVNNYNTSGETEGRIGYLGSSSTVRNAGYLDIYAPNLAINTLTSQQTNAGTNEFYQIWSRVSTTTQYTGISFLTLSATTMTGTFRVYGFRN